MGVFGIAIVANSTIHVENFFNIHMGKDLELVLVLGLVLVLVLVLLYLDEFFVLFKCPF